MCAIAGVLKLACDDGLLEKMLATMARRGPDGRGICKGEDFALLHTRLAIIDPQGGSQPMSLDWESERYTLVYNGELYNTAQLRQELRALGHVFTTQSDTEVILHAYVQWREECLERFNGIFAFAVWHSREKILFLARDRIGVKPLFYAQPEGGLVFASEIKTILAQGSVKPRLDGEGAAQLLMLGPGRIPGSGVFRDIRELEPGWYGLWQGGKLTLRQYWKLRDREHIHDFTQTCACVRELVTDAIRRQMVSDVPFGTFLSGGLDSSLISALCAREMENRGAQLQTFSVGYENHEKFFVPGKFQPNSDDSFIDIMTRHIHSQHRNTVLPANALADALQEAVIARDLPGMADVDTSLLLFCQDVRSHVKMALSGECADEIFGGYPWYRDPEIRAEEGFPWAQNTQFRKNLMHPDLQSAIDGEALVMDACRKTCRESDILPGCTDTERRMKEMVNLNFRWFMQTLLDRKDRMSMYSGLEVRVPFCDYRIAEYLYGVPWEMKDWQGKEKGLLRKAMEGILPEQVLWRKKSPYPKTFDPSYTRAVEMGVQTLLEDKQSPLFSLVDRRQVELLYSSEPVWPWYGQLMRRPQLLAYLLQLDFWLKVYQVEIAF